MQEKRRPHVGDIAIEHYSALIYIGVVEEVGWLQPDSEYGKGSATCYTVNNPKFYGLSATHYWHFADPNTVFIAPPEFVYNAKMELPKQEPEDEYCPRGCGQLSHHPPTGECPVELGLQTP
jgi:hypothetical protein